MNAVYQRHIRDGYKYTGIVSRGSWDRETIVARANELKVMGNKVVIVQKTEISNFRDRTDKHTYWVALVKYSEEYLAFKEAERARNIVERRNAELVKAAESFTLEELMSMLQYKADQLKAK